jgi:LuxR family maltose regulon positive regulatory protein
MPKATPYHLRWNLPRGTYTLHDARGEQELPLNADVQAWFDWLASISSFTFSGQHGHLTVRQETRSGGIYWYAYRRIGEKMAKRYLGRTTALTLARLEHVAAQLAAGAQGLSTPISGDSPTTLPIQHVLTSPLTSLKSIINAQGPAPALPQSLRDVRLASKLRVPRLRMQLVRRHRLIERLQQGLQVPLILLSAPAGFGKTTLLAQWIEESQWPSAWVSLEPEDNDPVRFLSALIAALQGFDPQLGTSALACFQPSPSSPPPSPETVVDLLLSDLYQQTPGEFILVLDDYHVVTNEALHQALAYLVEYAPTYLHLVIATRADPMLPLSRLRTRGQLSEVRADQLQFLPEETSSFLHAVMGLDLSDEERAVLQTRTEGWIAGLQLAALSLQGRSDVQQFLSEFTGSHRHIVDYLTEEVLARQPPDVQSFLLRTSLLAQFSSPLCEAVTGYNDGEEMLNYLERANLFLVPLDERRQWYRYHHLFAEVLCVRLQREVGTAGLTTLYRRASAWYEQNGMQAQAVEAALSAGDFERAARFIGINSPFVRSMFTGYEAQTLIGWLERFPREVLYTDANLCLVYAISLGISETPEAHEAPLAVAERLFQAEGNRKGLGQAYMLRALTASLRGDAVSSVRYGTQAFELSPEDDMLVRSTAASALVEGYRLGGEVVAASRVLAEARWLHEQSGNVNSILGDTMAFGDLIVMQGRLHEAADTYESVLEAAGKRQSYAIRALIGLGNIARERNELDTAETHLDQAVAIASKIGDQVMLARASLLLARTVQARGDAERTRDTWTEALRTVQVCSYRGLVEQALAYQVRGWLQSGRMDDVIRWQQDCSLSRDTPPTYQQEVIALTLVRVLLAQGEGAEALRILERWRQHARAQGRIGSEIEMLLLVALAQQTQGKREQAVQLLQQALLLASPEGYARVFVDEGVPIIALLSLTLSRWKSKPEAGYIHLLLSILQAERPGHKAFSSIASHQEAPLEPLSARERKVLHLLAAGLSNAEIAAELVVSINTIRTQARSIYHKLNVKNRHEAVALAHQWQLL